MTIPITYDRYSLIIPDGFSLDADSSVQLPAEQAVHEPKEGILPSLSLSFVRSDDVSEDESSPASDSPDFTEKLNLDSFSPTISLLTLPSRFNPDPFDYLQRGNSEMEKSTAFFKTDFCEKTMLGNNIAAYSQGALYTNFTIHRLVLAWIIELDLVVAEMTSLSRDIEHNWVTLHSFASSISLCEQSDSCAVSPHFS